MISVPQLPFWAWVVIAILVLDVALMIGATVLAWLEDREEDRPFAHDDWAREWEDRFLA